MFAQKVLSGVYLLLVALFFEAQAAESIIPNGHDYQKRLGVSRHVTAIENNGFGEELDGYSGALELSVADVVLPGNNGLAVEFRRRLKLQNYIETFGAMRSGAVGDWFIDVPFLHGEFLQTKRRWYSMLGATRCAVPTAQQAMAPPVMTGKNFQNILQYWHGNFLHIPGKGSARLLHTAETGVDVPQDGRSYFWTTDSRWHLSCLPATANGIEGDAFLAVDPDGTKYWFDQLVLALAPSLYADNQFYSRYEARMMPTRVEDRHGNWVVYQYDSVVDGRLLEIRSSDGRLLALEYNGAGRLAAVRHGSEIWKYFYDVNNRLIEVIRPDQSSWRYSPPFAGESLVVNGTGSCLGPMSIQMPTGILTVTHPSGAIGKFYLDVILSGRSYVPLTCEITTDDEWRPVGSYTLIPTHSYTVSLTKREVSGPGLEPMTWLWQYPLAQGSFESACQDTGCPEEKTIAVTRPDLTVELQTYGIRFGTNEGLLLRSELRGQGSGSPTRVTIMDYVTDPAGQRFPLKLGSHIFPVGSVARDRPIWRTQIYQNGGVFSNEVPQLNGVYQFDRFARPLTIVKTSKLTPP